MLLVCIELKDQYNIKSNFGKRWILLFQKRHKLDFNNNSNTKKTNNGNTKTTNSSSTKTNSSDAKTNNNTKTTSSSNTNNINTGISNTKIITDLHTDSVLLMENDNPFNEVTYSINHAFEAAVLDYLKDVAPLNRSNSTFLYHHSQIKNICLELRDQYNVTISKFSNTWTSSFQSRHNLMKVPKILQPDKKKCSFCARSAKSLWRKEGSKSTLTTIEDHEAKCSKNPLNNDKSIERNSKKVSMTRLNSPSKMTKTKAQPTLLDLFLLKKLRAKKHENIIHDYRIKNINMTKESLIEDWNMMNDESKSKIKLKVSNGNHIRKKKLLTRIRKLNKTNIEKHEYEMRVPKARKDYVPKPDNECNMTENDIKGLKSLIKNTGENSSVEKQKRVLAKLVNAMTMIPEDDKFVLKNFNKQRVIEANQNIATIKEILDNFLT